MSKQLELPAELQSLIEKRDAPDRRDAAQTSPPADEAGVVEDRRRAVRRSADREELP